MKTTLRQRIRELVPTLIKDLRLQQFEPSEITSELIAHNDGAFFKRHSDRFYGSERGIHDRLVTAVYYFHAEPKAFSGGALRIYACDADEGETDFIDVWPEQNMLVAFPSSAFHEVLPVSCPSRRFVDSRFAVNSWVCQRV